MIRRRALAILGSAGLHVCAVAALLALATSLREPSPLFVDLTGGGPAGDARPAEPPARGRQAAGAPPRQASRVIARLLRLTTPPAPLPAPAPAEPDERAPALDPAPTPLAAPALVPAPVPAPAPSVSASLEAAPAAAGARPTVAEADGREPKGVSSAAPTRAGQSSGAGGRSGALLALAGPAAGSGEVPPEYGAYLARFRERIQESVVYPFASRRRGEAGRVEIELLVDPTGRVRELNVVSSSSHALLDEAAVEAVRSVRPLPLPEHLPRRALRVRLPVIFQLR